jgi:hypothetical protein
MGIVKIKVSDVQDLPCQTDPFQQQSEEDSVTAGYKMEYPAQQTESGDGVSLSECSEFWIH